MVKVTNGRDDRYSKFDDESFEKFIVLTHVGKGPFTYNVITFCLFLDPPPFRNQIRHWIEQKLH